ncbi:MAG: hypothetical protein AB2A00_03250 [Myxococcota bacterium]
MAFNATRARRVLGLLVGLALAVGVFRQLYEVLARLLEEQGFTATWMILGRPMNRAATSVLVGAVAVIMGVALLSRWREGSEERELRRELERRRGGRT